MARLLGREVVIANAERPPTAQTTDVAENTGLNVRGVVREVLGLFVMMAGVSLSIVSLSLLAGVWAGMLLLGVILTVLGVVLGNS